MENNKYDVCGFDKEDALNDLHKNDLDIYKMYDLVFEDIVKTYIEEYNLYKGNSEDELILTKEEQQEIAHNLIYDREHLWSYIHETIDYEIERIFNNR